MVWTGGQVYLVGVGSKGSHQLRDGGEGKVLGRAQLGGDGLGAGGSLIG